MNALQRNDLAVDAVLSNDRGSWANTQKLVGKTKWPFELYYWDYSIGVFLFSPLFMFTLGSTGSAGMGALENLRLAGASNIAGALLSGVVFNISNILLVVAIHAAGMSLAFRVGVGLALVIGTVASLLQTPKGNAAEVFSGVGLVVLAMIMSAFAYSNLPRVYGRSWSRGLIFAVIAGCLMGFFYQQLVGTISPGFNAADVKPGVLTPYTALFFFAIGLLLSNMVVNTVFMKAGGKTYRE